ncbi:Fasciclin-like arabinogalactan protein 21 [Apostasia shenzhenica]|uniref:Fasciclin-like arabinogalactan protein 21 n=1 Tax=Apostasia shenzhenica TaxID=1088818 RepID=A0A2I0B4Q3_9ASPA|nr:Fasciclin-like arabinogalactan protein 21 [Apostasia shenzhenica]
MSSMAPAVSVLPLFALLSLLFSVSLESSLLPPVTAPQPQELHQQTGLLVPILSNLGFQELAMAVPALYSPVLSAWTGPVTLFAPSDDSIRTCPSCSAPRLLREHLVPGLFTRAYLSKLAFGTKLETASPGRCLTITSTSAISRSNASTNANAVGSDPSAFKIFVDGVEITRPDLFNDGRIVIHGIQGFVAPLSSVSCTQVSFPSSPGLDASHSASDRPGTAIMRLMLRDAILRLRDGGYSILALAMRVKYAELVGLHNMTVFALDDPSIFAGGHSYLTDVRFHVVPNRILMQSDLLNLPQGSVLPTLVQGQHLVVTQASIGPFASSIRINYVPIKAPDVVYNARIVIHSIFLPFPHLYLADLAAAAISDTPVDGVILDEHLRSGPAAAAGTGTGTCSGDLGPASHAECLASPAASPAVSMAAVDLDNGM